MADIQVHASLPPNADLDASNWKWTHCLTLPIDTLNSLQLSFKPYKWLRYAIGIVVGAQGDLSSSRDALNLVNYDASLPSESTVLYYHVSDAEKRRMFPSDPEIGHSRITSSVATTRRAEFRDEIEARDGDMCVLSSIPGDVCDAVHLIPHSKGDDYIKTYTEHRTRDPTRSDVVDDIDSIKNGLFLNAFTHRGLGKNLAFLVLPNFAMDPIDVDPAATMQLSATGQLCVAHLFVLHKHLLGNMALPLGSPIRISNSPDWPPAILFDAVYAGALIYHFGTPLLKEQVSSTWKKTFYPEVAAETKVINDAMAANKERKRKQDEAHHGPDTFDFLMMLPYMNIPPAELQAKLREKREKKEAAEQEQLRGKIDSWMNQTNTEVSTEG